MEQLHFHIFVLILQLILHFPEPVHSHGRLIEPPARGTMFRFGFKTPANTNDMALNCGGKSYQWDVLKGKCGVCGDPYDGLKLHEAGGIYATGTIAKCYEATTRVIEVNVDITAGHRGYFEFRLCPHNDPTTPITHDCLNRYLLPLADSSGTKYKIGNEGSHIYKGIMLRLPENVTCTQCVLQWKWNTGNSWGCDSDSCGLGKGAQEQFYGCSDIAILDDCSNLPTPAPPSQRLTTKAPTQTLGSTWGPTQAPGSKWRTTWAPGSKWRTTREPIRPPVVTPASPCRASGRFTGNTNMNNWCVANCARGFCPPSHCKCTDPTNSSPMQAPKPKPPAPVGIDTGSLQTLSCKPVFRRRNVPGLKNWCTVNCMQGFCPRTHCICTKLARN